MPPPWAKPLTDLAGFPYIDEDEVRKDAHAWRALQAGTTVAGNNADTAVHRLSGSYRGTSATALANHWNRVGGSGFMGDASLAARYAPVVLDGAATVITATKVAVIAQAAAGVTRIASAMATGGPLALGTVAATYFATRYAMRKVLREAQEGSARVLVPGINRRVTEPLQRLLQNLRGPMGAPPLAVAGGGRVPLMTRPTFTTGPRGFTTGPTGPRGIRILNMGRSRRNYSRQSGPQLSAAEREALEAKRQGKPYDRKLANSAEQKLKTAEKFEGKRNAQKRGKNK